LGAGADAPDRFATALAGYLGVWSCYPAASGRAALALLLRVLRETSSPERDEVVMPAYTCPALARVTLDTSLQPRLADVIPETLAMDEESLHRVAGPRTLAIIHVHPLGLPLAMQGARAIADEVGAPLIEDAAQALGARLPQQDRGAKRTVRAGAIGDYGLLSFGPGKPLSAGGGGAICVRQPESAARLTESWRNLPEDTRTRGMLTLLASRMVATPAGWWAAARLGALRWTGSEAGQRYRDVRMSPAAAAVGLRALPRLDTANTRRRDTALALLTELQSFDFVDLPSPAPGSEPIYLRLPVVFRDAATRDRAYDGLAAAGLGAGRMYRRSLAQQFPAIEGTFPGAQELEQRLLTLPTHVYVTEEDISHIIAQLRAHATFP
jgi:dTDP-4-amino-4,6-dideoxygalactose transaminase